MVNNINNHFKITILLTDNYFIEAKLFTNVFQKGGSKVVHNIICNIKYNEQ